MLVIMLIARFILKILPIDILIIYTAAQFVKCARRIYRGKMRDFGQLEKLHKCKYLFYRFLLKYGKDYIIMFKCRYKIGVYGAKGRAKCDFAAIIERREI